MKWLASFGCVLALVGCSDIHTELVPLPLGVEPGPRPGRDAGMSSGDAGIVMVALCGDKPCECADGKDNDRDGLIDGLDPECTSSVDDKEATFATRDPKQPLNDCEDCFWDDNASSDDDGCGYPSACRSEGPAAMPGPPPMTPPGMMTCRSCEVMPRCVDSCRSHTPNGCDCFGCCEVTGADGAAVNVVLSDECSVKDVDKMNKCPPCVPNAACFNPCGRCELCFGKKQEDLPADCTDSGVADVPAHACDDGYRACSESDACPEGFYCVLGCCMVTVF